MRTVVKGIGRRLPFRFDRFTSRSRHVVPPDFPGSSRHTIGEDIYACAIGSSFIVTGLVLLREIGLVTGGMAGIALLLSYILPLETTELFVLVNLPFFWLAYRVMGRAFTTKTMAVSVLVAGLGQFMAGVVDFAFLDPVFAALFGGTIIGMGVLALARHGAGVGGSGVVALSLQKTKGWNAGLTQLAGDCAILALAVPILTPGQFGHSVLSAAAINGVLIVNHRPGRYLGH